MSQKDIEIITNSAAETVELGQKIGASLKGGEVFALVGNLGTGKTHLIKGISLGLAAHDPDQVSSPTFVLVNEYFGRDGLIHIYHIDAYRVETPAEFAALGFEEYCRPVHTGRDAYVSPWISGFLAPYPLPPIPLNIH